MNWVDLIIILVIIVFGLEGLKRGFFVQVFDIIGFFTSLIAALIFYGQAAGLLLQFFKIPKIAANPIGFLTVWIIVEALFFTFASALFRKILAKFHQTIINRYLGFIPSAVNSLLFMSFLLMFLISIPIKAELKRNVFDSKIGSVLIKRASVFEKPINSIFGPIAKQSLTFLTVKPDEKGSIKLEFTQKDLKVDYAAEQKMLALLNEERNKLGIKSLVWNEKLAQVGRAHSKDMFERGYFSHYSPEGKDVGDRITDAGISYNYAGENLALAPDVIRAHDGLMNSPGHRENILNPAYSKIGIGAIDGGVYGEMFTQVFTN